MCRTVHAVLSTAICGIQMLVRVFMTVILMLENLIRMLLQTFYNFVSFMLQMISLLPICCVFLITSRLKCFMCGGGGPCPVNRGGACDCLMSALAIIILFFIFRATGVLDKIFYSMGYAKAPTQVARFIPTPGDITECSRNDTEITEYDMGDYSSTPTNLLNFDEFETRDEHSGSSNDVPGNIYDLSGNKAKPPPTTNKDDPNGIKNNVVNTPPPTITNEPTDGNDPQTDHNLLRQLGNYVKNQSTITTTTEYSIKKVINWFHQPEPPEGAQKKVLNELPKEDSNEPQEELPGDFDVTRARLTTHKTKSSVLFKKLGKITKTTVFYYLV